MRIHVTPNRLLLAYGILAFPNEKQQARHFSFFLPHQHTQINRDRETEEEGGQKRDKHRLGEEDRRQTQTETQNSEGETAVVAVQLT